MSYDGFEDGTIDKWTPQTVEGGTLAADIAAKLFGVYGGRMTTDGDNDDNSIIYTNSDANVAAGNFYAWWRTTDAATYGQYEARGGATFLMGFRIEGGKFVYWDVIGSHEFTETPSPNTWYRLRFEYDAAGSCSYYLYDENNALLEEHTGLTPRGEGESIDEVRINAKDTSAVGILTDWDNVCLTETDEPPPPSTAHMNMKGYW